VAAGRFAPDPGALAAQRQEAGVVDHETPIEEVFEDQLACADLIVINKTDLVDGPTLEAVTAQLRAALPDGRARLVRAVNGQADPLLLLGLGAAVEDDLDRRISHHDAEEGHDHDDFTSFIVELPPQSDPQGLTERLKRVADAHGVLRIKGFVDVPGRPMRLLVQGVGSRLQVQFDRFWRPGEARRSRLVVIGETGIDGAAVSAALAG
jgi:cobalamin biosynthesis protein CobW